MPCSSQSSLRSPSNRAKSVHHTGNAISCSDFIPESPLHAKSRPSQSASRVFIKPKDGPSAKLERTSSFAYVPQQRSNIKPYVPKSASSTHALPRRIAPRSSSSFLLPAETNTISASAKRLHRSVTTARLGPFKTAAVPENDSGFFAQDLKLGNMQVTSSNVMLGDKSLRRTSRPKYKENAPPLLNRTSSDRSSRRSFTRVQSPLVPKERRESLCASRTFLVPRAEAEVPAADFASSDIYPFCCTPTREAGKSFSLEESSGLAATTAENRLPSATSLALAISSLPTQILKHTPRPSSLALDARFSLSSSLRSNFPRLPTQILKHTPCAPHTPPALPPSPAASSPCLSKARTKTVWTMADEITLVRTGGVLPGGLALAPSSQARVVPLFQRLRNGVSPSGSAQELTSSKVPVRSASIPYHLLTSSARRSESFRAALTRSKHTAILPAPKAADAHATSDEGEGSREPRAGRSPWTVVNIKKGDQHGTNDSSAGAPAGNSHGQGGYGVYAGAGSKPSLLTRAQTLVKLKFAYPRSLTSRKLVGRGDPRF
ncbi:hypothetical protein DFH11DRAFT_1541288 [Phellopilus nigrolimitatus]|nr:hypothetical protein DFH11DRAFT_1541288 [Phellopilus nigrolimitatus]